MPENSAYNDLVDLFRRIGIINDAIAILDWDQSTMMPEGSASSRSEQLATLSVLSHDLLTQPKISELLDKVEVNNGGIDAWKVANVAGMKRAHLHAISVPAGNTIVLVEAGILTLATSNAAFGCSGSSAIPSAALGCPSYPR